MISCVFTDAGATHHGHSIQAVEKGSSGGGRKSDFERRTGGGRKPVGNGATSGQPKNPTQRPEAQRKPASTGPGG